MEIQLIKGFTLTEIALVLVASGLLIGGVLKGQEMVANAKLKRIISDSTGIAAAIFSYQDRYLQLPGDDSKAGVRFSIYVPGDPVNGDGSGTIDGDWNTPSTGDVTATLTSETNLLFAHLRAAGMIPGNGLQDSKLINAYGGLIGIRDGALGISGHVIIFGQIDGVICRIIEARLDDDDPSAGKIQSGQSSGGISIDMNSALVGSATYDDSERYNMAFHL